MKNLARRPASPAPVWGADYWSAALAVELDSVADVLAPLADCQGGRVSWGVEGQPAEVGDVELDKVVPEALVDRVPDLRTTPRGSFSPSSGL